MKYENLDGAIMARMGKAPVGFTDLHTGTVREHCDALAAQDRAVPSFRMLDRRLQALRKAAKIRFTGKGWVKA